MTDSGAARELAATWDSLLGLGRDPVTGGYRRFAWTGVDASLREWFADQAARRGLDCQVDRNGNQWAWWGPPGPDAVVTGSHLDSVPDGGAYDGPLGIVSAFLAVDALRAQGAAATRPVAVVCFTEEEGARFSTPCVGSRLLTGALDPDRARGLRDRDGVTLAEAMRSAGAEPGHLGRDDESLSRIGVFVELHVEQGRALVDLDRPVAVASAIWPHGRWRYRFGGRADHAGTTRLEDRADPLLPFAETVLSARRRAGELGALATFGRVEVRPNATNGIAAEVDAWLDGRAPDQALLDRLVAGVESDARRAAGELTVHVRTESLSPAVTFAEQLRDDLARLLAGAPLLPTGAGHDAGVLSAHVPTAMLFVRNPTGVSHSPAEHATPADCLAGVEALTTVLRHLACR